MKGWAHIMEHTHNARTYPVQAVRLDGSPVTLWVKAPAPVATLPVFAFPAPVVVPASKRPGARIRGYL